MGLATLCRFANQNIFDLLGRDPRREPLTTLELELFQACIYQIVTDEFSPSESAKGESSDE